MTISCRPFRHLRAVLRRRSPTALGLATTRALLSIILVAGAPAASQAQGPAPLPPQTPSTGTAERAATGQADSAVLAVRGRRIVVFRTALGALSSAERAAAAASRIEVLVRDGTRDSVSARAIPEGVLISAGARNVFTITPADVDTLHGESLPRLATGAAASLRSVLADAREAGSLAHILTAAAFAILATAVFLVLLRLLRFARRALFARLPAAAGARLRAPSVGGFTLIAPENLLLFARRLVDLVAWAIGLFVAYLWLAFVLTRFPYTRPWGEALGAYLTTTVARLALSALSSVPGLFTVVLIVVATRWISRLISSFFDAVEAATVDVPWVHPETANPTKRIAVALLWLFAIVVAYPYLPGSGSDVFKGVSVFAGLVLSLGSSGVVNQAMSGLVLMYSRAFRPGDYVRIGETEGVVATLGMLSTKVRTTKREHVTLPNAVVAGASVKNYSRAGVDAGLLLYTSVTIGYDTPWRQVEALLVMAARRTDGLRRELAPFVLKTGLGDFYVEYQLNAALERPEERVRVLDQLHGHVLDCFNEYGVQITSPHYVKDPANEKVVPRERWHSAPADGGGRSS